MPPVSSGSSSKQKQLSKAPTFQINGYERGRLKSFPPHTIPKPRVIRFDARNVRHDSLNCLCRQCLTDKKTPVSRTSSGEADVTIGDPNIKLPEILPIIKSSIRNEVDSKALLWWPTLSNSRCTEPISPWGMQVSRELFQAVLSDHMSLEALSALVYACELVATPLSGRVENRRKVLEQKTRVTSLLRTRLEKGSLVDDQVVMTMFFLVTLDLLDGSDNLSSTWEVHLHAIAQLANTDGVNSRLAFKPHFRSRTQTYVEYLSWMKSAKLSFPTVNPTRERRKTYPAKPFPSEFITQISALSTGFAAIAQTISLNLETIQLILHSCQLDASFTSLWSSWSSSLKDEDRNRATSLMTLAQETNFRCNDLLLSRNLNHIEEIIVLALSSSCQYSARTVTERFGIPAFGLGISTLLVRLSCISLAREGELREVLVSEMDSYWGKGEKVVRWAGRMLVETGEMDRPKRVLGRRLLKFCGGEAGVGARWRSQEMCRMEFVWPEGLPV